MSPEEQKAWEEEEMRKRVDFSRCTVDQTPIQLVAKTTLLKVHSLFSLLGINRAYVTEVGRLVGVVAMREVRTQKSKKFQPQKISAFSPKILDFPKIS